MSASVCVFAGVVASPRRAVRGCAQRCSKEKGHEAEAPCPVIDARSGYGVSTRTIVGFGNPAVPP